jgi:hypothetical protein
MGFGRGKDGIQSARATLNADRMALIRNSLSRKEVEAQKALYEGNVAAGKGLPVAAERAAYIREVLRRY